MLKKPVKFVLNNPIKDVPLDYEMAGKVLDNLIVMAENQGCDIEDPSFDKFLTFSIGKEHEYGARLWHTKIQYTLEIGYMRRLPTAEQPKMAKILPKDRKRLDAIKAEEKAKKKAEAAEKRKKAKEKIVDEKK